MSTKTKTKSVAEKPVRGMTMAMTERFVRDAYDNFPEASMCLACTTWRYEKFEFAFLDREEGKVHIVKLPDAIRGLHLLIAAVDAGKLKGLGLGANYLDPEEGLCDWDAFAFDALNQMAIFGEVIYG